MPGLLIDVSIKSLLNSGFNLIYNETYDYITTDSEIYALKNTCASESILCIGGGPVGSDTMRLVACANCLAIIQPTLLNQPRYVGFAYWYFTETKGFGFSPDNTIQQNICDINNPSDNLRLCWHTDNKTGGYRLGNLTINYNSSYSKYAFVRHGKLFKLNKSKFDLIMIDYILK